MEAFLGFLVFVGTVLFGFVARLALVLAVMAVLAVLVFAFALWRTLRALAAKRLQDGDE